MRNTRNTRFKKNNLRNLRFNLRPLNLKVLYLWCTYTMKQTSQHIILFIAAVISLYALSLPSCSNPADRTVCDKLALVDTLLLSDPDAALDTLATLPDSIAHPATAAWRDLLTAKARDKATRTQRDYSVEQRAYRYYIGANDSLEYQSAYYFGSQLSYCNRNDSALIVLTDALDLSLEHGDMFYAAITARDLSNLYGNILVAPKELEYAIKAKQYFIEAKRPEHAAWQDLMIISGLYLNDRYDEAIEVISNIDSAYINDDTFREILNDKKVTMYSIYNKYDNVIATYNEMIVDNHKMTNHDWCLLADAYADKNDWDNAEYALKNTTGEILTKRDSVFASIISSRILAAQGDYQNAYNLMYQSAFQLNEINEAHFMNPENLLLNDYIQLKAKKKERHAEIYRNYVISLSAALLSIVLLSIFIVLFIRTRLRKKRAEVAYLKVRKDMLEHQLSEQECIIRHQIETNKKIQETKRDNEPTTDKETIEALRKHIDSEHTIYDALISNWCNEISSPKGAELFRKATIKELQKVIESSFIDRMVALKDMTNNRAMAKFRLAFPNISEEDYLIIKLYYIKFKPVSIEKITGRNSNSIYQTKHKIKKLINSIDPILASDFIKRLDL